MPWLMPWVIWRYSTKNKVYITFDDGPFDDTTPWLLDYCAKENIPITFFWLGENSVKNPDYMAQAKKAGHKVGSHGYYHFSGFDKSKLEVKENIKKGLALVPDNLFRPPYGEITRGVAKEITKTTPVVLWSWLSYDWDDEVDEKTILNSLTKTLKGGDILVFHENKKSEKRIKKIFPEAVKIIRNKGLEPALIE